MILANLLFASTVRVQEAPPGDPARVFVQISETAVLKRIAFGSCHDQSIPKLAIPLLGMGKDIWTVIRDARPRTMILLGDNVYAKTTDMDVMQAAYDRLEADDGFIRLRRSIPILATWDDNDYGYSDVGAEYPKKSQSQALFLEFFGVPKLSARWGREGIYDAVVYGKPGARTQIILLDTRYFRGPLRKRGADDPPPPPDRSGPYIPTTDKTTTILGEAQWKWLAEQLQVPAEVRIIASSIQVISEEHGYEKWANFPHERQRLFQLLRDSKAQNVIIISGDRHHAEISKLDGILDNPLYDVTSSSLNKPRIWTVEANRHRVGEMYFQANFGILNIAWDAPEPCVSMEIHSSSGDIVLSEKLPLRLK